MPYYDYDEYQEMTGLQDDDLIYEDDSLTFGEAKSLWPDGEFDENGEFHPF